MTADRWAMIAAAALLAALTVTGCREGAPPRAGRRGEGEPAFEAPLKATLVASRRPGLEGLAGIDVGAGGRIYLACRTGVVVFDARWNRVGELPTDGPAAAVAVHEDGRAFVAERQKVRVFSADGKPLASWGTPGEGPGEFSLLTGIAVRGTDVWLADANNRVIHHFDATGDFVEDLGRRDPAAGVPGIICPSPYLDCAVGADGTLYHANPGRWRVEHYDLNRRPAGHFGKASSGPLGFSGCCNPTNLTVMADGRIVTAEKGTPRVKVHGPDAAVLAVIGPEHFSPDSRGMDLATDAAGRIYVVEPAAGKVLVFTLSEGP
jgi:sugar lactone lactonase YvrE